jgi:hypothetical protein
MPFGYYHQLDAKAQRIYRASDKVLFFYLPDTSAVKPVVLKIFESLQAENIPRTQKWAQHLLNILTDQLLIRPLRLELLEIRPSNPRMELHGLYYPTEGRRIPKIQLWMRTATRHQIIAFRTFLRTLIHEFCHHLDYDCLGLKDSFHTQGFYKRESSLVSQIMPPSVVTVNGNGTHSQAAKMQKMLRTKTIIHSTTAIKTKKVIKKNSR